MMYHKGGLKMKDSEQRKYGLPTDSRGMASILITLVTMIVVTLIVLGFAQVSRREQGNTLDQQLSTQAFYAAETAVNDARNVIDNFVQADQPIPAKPNCNTDPANNYPVPNSGDSGVILDSTGNGDVSYTCLIVNPTPNSLQKDGVGDNSWVVPVSSTSPFDTINIKWSPDPKVTTGSPATDCPDKLNSPLDTFGPASGAAPRVYTCGYGVLRMDIVPTAGSLTGGSGAGSLLSEQLTGFFEPLSANGGSTLKYIAGKIGKANVITASCTAAYNYCTAHITNLTANNYTLRINSLYKASNITVTALSNGTPVPVNGQVLVDATGDANGVLRRIQVRFSAFGDNGLEPRYALQSDSAICKRFSVSDGTPSGSGYFQNANDIQGTQDPVGDQNYNAMCNPAGPDGTP